MRQIGTLANEDQARRFGNYLRSLGIANNCDVSFDPVSSHMSYQIWVHEEDKLQQALAAFEEFQNNPSHFQFDSSPQEECGAVEEAPLQQSAYGFRSHLTLFLISLCVLIFFLNTLEELPLLEEGLSENTFLVTPIQAALLYDLPPAIDDMERVIEKYEIKGKKYTQIPPQVKNQLATAENTPYWRGIYDWIVYKIKGEDTAPLEGPLFIRIRQGEIWRLVSPCILHSNFLHLLFNMLWLWYLGRPIEQRLGPVRTLLFSLIAGVGSNTVQYFMSGPFFLGYSGIVTALAGFIWMREKVAPWEGYPITQSVLYFLAFFIGAIFVLDFATFLIQAFTHAAFNPNIANAAHIAGALIGMWLGRYSFFAQRVHR